MDELYSRRNLDRIKRLKDRLKWLDNRIATSGDKVLSYDMAEASALRWIIELVENLMTGNLEVVEKVKKDEQEN